MYTMQPKKMLILNILEILRKHSDADHRLSQSDILHILERDYQMKAERKAIKRNLMNLIDAGYPVRYTQTERVRKNGERDAVLSDWYLDDERFTNAELRLIVDGLLSSRHIPATQCRQLIGKMEELSGNRFKAGSQFVDTLPQVQPESRQLFYTIEVLDEAIAKGCKVRFHYGSFGVDIKMRPRVDSAGQPRVYEVSPYRMATANGRYYLIANADGCEDLFHYRVDRILDIQLTDTPARPLSDIDGAKGGLNLPKHLAEHIYMFSGKSALVTFRAKGYLVNEIVDWFGRDVEFNRIDDDGVVARVRVNEEAMRYWALQYAPHVRVLTPHHLAKQVRADLEAALDAYDASA